MHRLAQNCATQKSRPRAAFFFGVKSRGLPALLRVCLAVQNVSDGLTEDAVAQGTLGTAIDLAALGTTADAGALETIAPTFADDGTGTLTLAVEGAASASVVGKVHNLTRDANGGWLSTTTMEMASGFVPKGCAGV